METRYIEEYKDSKLINKIPYEVSDEELIMEIENNMEKKHKNTYLYKNILSG